MKNSVLLGTAMVGLAIAAGAAGYRFGSKPNSERGARQVSHEQLGTPRVDPARPAPDTNDALRSQLAQLELKVAALTAYATSEKTNNAAPPQASPAEAVSASSPEQIARDAAQWEAHMVAVDADFEAEERDPSWAHSTTNLLRDRAIADEVMRTAVKQVECRSTICRVEMVDDKKGAFEHKLPEFLHGLSGQFPTGQASTVENPDGTRTLSVYLSTTSGADAPGSRG